MTKFKIGDILATSYDGRLIEITGIEFNRYVFKYISGFGVWNGQTNDVYFNDLDISDFQIKSNDRVKPQNHPLTKIFL